MSILRTHVTYLLLSLCMLFSATLWAQPSSQVSGLQALQRSGQTFLTWNEISGADVVYKVYRHSSAITNLAAATYLGQVDQNSSLNKRAADAGMSSYYRIVDLGSPLSDGTGLFVNTATANGNFYYAVVASNGGGTNTSVTLGINSLNAAVNETVGLPEPVLQANSSGSRHYVHYLNFQNTPLLPAMANRPGATYNFILNNLNTGTAQHLVVGLYGGSNDFTSKVDKIDGSGLELQMDDPPPDPFAPAADSQDDAVHPLNVCWYGYGENFSVGQVLTSGKVQNYLQLHIIYTINWVLRTWPHVDENRVYLTGSSFGGIGAIALGMAFPHVFAAIWANVPRFDMGEPEWDLEYDSPITDRYQTVWGATEQNLPTPNIKASYPDYAATGEGYNVYERLDQVYVANQNPQTDFPVIITGVGKQDSHVGWHEKPQYINAMNASHHQLYLYWENTGHKFETTVFDSVYKRTQLLNYRRNLSYPALSNLSINNNPGLGNDLLPGGSVTGESQGTINGFVGWQGASVIDTPSQYRIKIYLRGALMDAFSNLSGVQTATATVTPRRLQNFPRTPNATYSYENRRASDNVLLASGNVTADANGLVHVNNFQISRTGNYLILNNSTPANQAPNAVASANPTSGTAPLNVQFTGSSSTDSDGAIASYAWSFGDGGTATNANPQRTYNAAGNYSARLIVTDDDGAKDTAFVAIQVSAPNQAPNAIATANPTSGTAPLNVQFTGSSSTDSDGSIASYAWSFGDGGTATSANPLRTYNAAGNYSARLIVTDDDGAKDTAFVAIQVNSVAANQPPNAVAAANPTNGFAPLHVQFTGSNSTDSDGSIASYAWSFGDGGTATTANPLHAYNTAGNYSARLIVTDDDGAKDTAFVAIQVLNSTPGSLPTIRVNVGGPQYVSGSGKTFLADNVYSAGSFGYLTYSDLRTTLSSITNTTDPALYQDARGDDPFNYRFDVPNGSYDVLLHFAEIQDDEAAKRVMDVTLENNLVLDELDVWVAAGGRYIAYTRLFNIVVTDGQLNIDFFRTPASTKRKPVVAAIEIGAAGSLTGVPVNQPPNALASANPTGGVAPLNVQFTGSNSTDGDGTLASYAWNFGDGGTATTPNPLHSFNAAGNYSARLIVIDDDGASDTAFVAIQVSAANQPPNAIASANPTGGVAPLNVQFTGSNSTDGDGTLASYVWNFGDGGTATTPNPSHSFNAAGNYSARLIVIDDDGASDTAFVAIQVNTPNQPPNAVASANPTSGKAPLAVQFTGGNSTDSDGTITAYAWNFKDGTTGKAKNPLHTFNNVGTYKVRLIVTDNSGAKDTAFVTIKVTNNTPPNAVASANPTSGKAPLTVQFTGGNSTDSDGTIASYAWNFADGTTGKAKNPLHTFNNVGVYNVRLIVTDSVGAKDTAFVQITVSNNAAPNAVASAIPASGIAPLNVQFTGSNSNDSDGTITSYAWNFGDGGNAAAANPLHTYNTPGSYSASLIVTDNNGAKDTAFVQMQVNANQPPQAVASGTPTSGNSPLLVQFTGSNSADSDGNIAAFKWTFGDGDSATIANPSHTYNDAGNYLARLIVTDNLGARDTAEVNVTVTALAATTIIRVNAGGGQYTATNGNFFSADQSYAPGSWGYTALGYAKTTTTGIANTTESPLYQDLHEKAELSYRFDVPNGAYDLILHFVEIADNEANRRLIDATAEGNIVVNDLDVWVAAGGKYVALRRSITGVVVSDGQLNLDFVRSISSVKRPPAIAAIEVGTAGSLSLAKEHESSFTNVLVPEAYALEQNYPNPFNPTTVITFSLPQAGEVRLAFYNALGQPARRPIVRYFTAGRYKITIDASEWAAGVYFYEMKVNNYRALKKMILAK